MPNGIAYVTNTGTINVVDSNFSLLKCLSLPDMELSWPTFSNDNENIIFSGTRFVSGVTQKDISALYSLNFERDEIPHLIYTNQIGTGMISAETPHYAICSPDSSKIAFIAQTIDGGMTLFLKDLNSELLDKIIDGAPIYFSWSPDSKFLLAHVNDSYYLVDVSSGDVTKFSWKSTLCMCPMWSPEGNYYAIGVDSEEGSQDFGLVDRDGNFSQILKINGSATFLWSPSGEQIVLSENLDHEKGYYNSTFIMNSDGSDRKLLTSDPLLCMFWSPMGNLICYVTLSENAYGSLRFAVSDLSGEVTYLPDFKPSQSQLISYMFFDQYSIAHSPWCADGTKIIFSGRLGYVKERTPLPTNGEVSVFQVAVENPVQTQKIGQGLFGVWRR